MSDLSALVARLEAVAARLEKLGVSGGAAIAAAASVGASSGMITSPSTSANHHHLFRFEISHFLLHVTSQFS